MSANGSQILRLSPSTNVSAVTTAASTRCVYAYTMPPSRGGTSLPHESGQSGIAPPASLLVTNAPAITSNNVANVTNAENRCNRLPLDGEVRRLAFFRADSHLLLLLAVFLMHDFDGVGPRRQSLQCISPIVARDGEERVRHHADVGAHPRVNVAL